MPASKKHPVASLALLSVITVFFTGSIAIVFHSIDLALDYAGQLPLERIVGLAAIGLGWGLAALLWQQLWALKQRQVQLEHANAELHSKQQELLRLTRLDGLTGLYNRNTFVELTHRELARAQRQGSDTTLLLLDMDLFKCINDTWGHPAGDTVLKNFAIVANSTVRATDLVGRFGGEEFIILLPNTTLDAGRMLAEKLRTNLVHNPTRWHEEGIINTVSIGVASTTASQHHTFDQLYSQADMALYRAKEMGRNRVV